MYIFLSVDLFTFMSYSRHRYMKWLHEIPSGGGSGGDGDGGGKGDGAMGDGGGGGDGGDGDGGGSDGGGTITGPGDGAPPDHKSCQKPFGPCIPEASGDGIAGDGLPSLPHEAGGDGLPPTNLVDSNFGREGRPPFPPKAHKGGWWPSMQVPPPIVPPLYKPKSGNAWPSLDWTGAPGVRDYQLGCGKICQATYRGSACACPACGGSCFDIRMIALNYARHLLYVQCWRRFWYDRGHCLKAPACCGCGCGAKIKCMDQCLCIASAQGGYVYNGGKSCEGDYTKSGALNPLIPAYRKGHVIYCGFACQKCNTHCFEESDTNLGERMARQIFKQGYDGTQDGCPPIWWYSTMRLAVTANYLPDRGGIKLPSALWKKAWWPGGCPDALYSKDGASYDGHNLMAAPGSEHITWPGAGDKDPGPRVPKWSA